MNDSNKKQYFNSLGEKFDEYMSDYDVARRKELIFDRLLKNKPLKGKRILEIGCGTGKFSAVISKNGAMLTVLDIGPRLVSDVVSAYDCLGTSGDATILPFKSDSFDAIVSSECIEHTPDPTAAIQEMCRVCKPGGVVCFTTPNRLWFPLLLLSEWLGIRKFSGIENWIYPTRGIATLKAAKMTTIHADGCHLWPFQLKMSRPLLRRMDIYGKFLFPFMINFGLVAVKSREKIEP